jgi:hypothetical protein
MDKECSKSVQSVVNALHALESANLIGAIGQEHFAQLIDDYFGGQDPVSSDNNDSENDESDTEEASPLLDDIEGDVQVLLNEDFNNNIVPGEDLHRDNPLPTVTAHAIGTGSDSDRGDESDTFGQPFR